VRTSLFPPARARVFIAHTHPESLLGVLRPLVTEPPRTEALGYINRGGTLDEHGMLFATAGPGRMLLPPWRARSIGRARTSSARTSSRPWMAWMGLLYFIVELILSGLSIGTCSRLTRESLYPKIMGAVRDPGKKWNVSVQEVDSSLP